MTEPAPNDSAESISATNDRDGSSVDHRVSGWLRVVVNVEKGLAALCLFLIVAFMGAQVFARYVFGSPFSGSEEAARLSLIWMTFIAASFVMAEGRHIAVDLISERLSEAARFRFDALSHIIVAGTCLLLAIGGSRFVWYVGKVGSPSLGIPRSFWYGAVIVGLLLMAFHSILNLLQVMKTGRPLARETVVEEEGFHLDMEAGE